LRYEEQQYFWKWNYERCFFIKYDMKLSVFAISKMHVSVVYLKQIGMFMDVFEHKMSATLYLVVSKHISKK